MPQDLPPAGLPGQAPAPARRWMWTLRMQFSGGITSARAHAGENAGRSAVVALVTGAALPAPARTSVFGCPLFARSTARLF